MKLRHLGTFITCIGISMVLSSSLLAQGTSVTIAQTGDTANGDGAFASFTQLFLNDVGDASFISLLSGTSSDLALYFRSAAGNMIEIVRESDSAPNANGTFSTTINNVGLNGSGDYLFFSSLLGTNGGSSDDSGLFTGNNGTLTTAAREGNTTFDANGKFGSFFPGTNVYGFNESGATAFKNSNVNTIGGTADNDAVFANNGLAVREGNTAPGGIGNFGSFGIYAKINGSNQTSFVGFVGSISGMYRSDSFSVITPIFVEGDDAPDGNGVLSFLEGFMSINDAGQTAFQANMTGTSNGTLDDEGCFRGDGNSLIQIMREGNIVPGGNGVFRDLKSTSVRLNQSGQVAFSSGLRETNGGNSDNSAIYRSSSSGFSLVEIAREGDAISSGDGLVASIGFVLSSLNESGVVAFHTFLSGTSNDFGIFIGDGEELLTVAQEGQPLNGSTILALEFTAGESFQSGLNNNSQVLFEAILADGTSLLQIWTPDLHWRRTFSSDWDISSSWTLGIKPDAIHDVYIDPANTLTVQGPSADTTVRSLTIGSNNGIATFQMEDGAILTTTNDVQIEESGILTGDGSIDSDVNNLGIVKAQNVFVAGTIFNDGTIEGNGRLYSDIVNNANGKIQSSDGAPLRLTGPTLTNSGDIRVQPNQQLQIEGANFTNMGLIDVVGGTFEVTPFTDNFDGGSLIFASDAFLRFNGGLQNAGGFGITSGTTYVYGDVNNIAGGIISVSGGAITTFVDDLTQNGILQVVSVGNTYSSAVFFGAFSGAGGFTGGGDVFALGDLRPGNSPASVTMGGNLFLGFNARTEIEISSAIQGEFDQLVVTGNLSLDGTLDVVLLNGFTPVFGDEFLIVDVVGDIVGEFIGLPHGSTIGVGGLYIYYDGGDGNDIVLSTIPPQTELAPDSFLVTNGTYSAGDVTHLAQSDNSDVSIRRRASDIQSRTEFEVSSVSPVSVPFSLSITLEGAVFARTGVNQTISLFDYDIGIWEIVDTRSAMRFNDRVDTISITGDLTRFVEAGTNSMKARVLYKSIIPRQQFTSNTDQFLWTVGH